MPWRPAVQHVDEFLADLRAEHSLRQSTVRAYQNALRLFCAYLIEPAYGWDRVCEQHFGTHPTQDNEQDPRKRAFTRPELQAFFDRADAEVARTRSLGRKGWLPAMRDAVLFKTAYAWGLRRNEVAHLQSVDFARNPHAREFGRYRLLHVRHGKAHAGSAPKRRAVLTVFDWSSEVVGHWIARGLPLAGGGLDLFPSERGTLVSTAALSARFRRYRDELGQDKGLDMHSLRRSYITHLIEDGTDALFVQQQAGHDHASTTALYTCVSSDYRTRTLRAALDTTIAKALNAPGGSR